MTNRNKNNKVKQKKISKACINLKKYERISIARDERRKNKEELKRKRK